MVGIAYAAKVESGLGEYPRPGLPEAQEGDLVDVVVVDAAAVVAPGDAERHRLV
jgi:hypothetical protein